MIIVTKKLDATAIHIPVVPRLVFDRNHANGTLTSHSDSNVKIMVIIVCPAPLMTPFEINMMAKKM